MPRKKLIYTHETPYHIWARSNNREWFYVDKKILWKIFVKELNELTLEFDFAIHAFVLMDNHYHLIATTSENHDLGLIMQRLQRRVASEVNRISGRINHVFGGSYKASLILAPENFSICLKYVLRNPVRAGLVSQVEYYRYSDAIGLEKNGDLILTSPMNARRMFLTSEPLLRWLNVADTLERSELIKKALKKTIFKLKDRARRKLVV